MTKSGVCARCGHTSPQCERCGRSDPVLGGYVAGVGSLCHTFESAADRPTCYELESRIRRDPPTTSESAVRQPVTLRTSRWSALACDCACVTGGFCGGCGHAGCGRR